MTRRENTRTRRARAAREERARILLLCGAEVTEPSYFRGLKQRYRHPAVNVVRKGGKDPVSLIRLAAKLREQDECDETWCVIDVDEYNIDAAFSEAQRLDVKLAVSNPCFEYWLLLHFERCEAPLPCFQDVEPRLRQQVRGYNKKSLNFSDYAAGVTDAVDRAKHRCGDITRAHQVNPSTGVWALVERISTS
ncbi:RloB family protein [Prauserella halophila]|uniref:RloB family protein n=1 Tax=Prauserella halophila TaxID=185641 RepID=A0ABN1W3W1_9PSEU|nr:RloB family protein [Prauserella halophila]MCP2236056.1 RloB-like protein [Prauserella halophila]